METHIKIKVLLFISIFTTLLTASGQNRVLTLEEAITLALENNMEYKSGLLEVEQEKANRKSAFTLEQATIFYGWDKNNAEEKGYPLNIIGIEQNISFPTVYASQNRINKTAISLSEMNLEKQRLLLMKNVSKEYYKINYLMNKEDYYNYLDTLYRNLVSEVSVKLLRDDASKLDLLNVKAKHQQIIIAIDHLRYDISTAYKKLALLINNEREFTIPKVEPAQLIVSNQPLRLNPGVQHKNFETQMSINQLQLERNSMLPGISLSFFNGFNRKAGPQNYPGFQVGLSLPLFFQGQKPILDAGKIAVSISKNEAEIYLRHLRLEREELMNEIRKLRESLNYFITTGKKLGDEIIKNAKESYESKEIDLFQYVQSIENAIEIEMEYLDWLCKYNNVVLDLNYLVID